MEEKELFNYGDKELNVNSLLKYIDSNQLSYLDFYSNSISDTNAFIEKVNYIKEGIKNGNITTDGTGVYTDASGKILENDELMSNALHYVDIIAKELSKKPRALTLAEITLREEAKRAAALKLSESDDVLQETKLNFDPENPFIFEHSLKKLFGPTLEIPYTTLKKTITRGADGKEDYSIVKEQFKNAFNSMRKYLNKYNNSDNYISLVNNLETALFDGVWDHRDELAIHQAGLNKDLNNLKELFTYKLPAYNPRQNYKQQIDQVINPGDYTVMDGDQKSILYLDELGKYITENITDDEYYKLSGTSAPVIPTDNVDDLSLEELAQALEDDKLGWEVLGPLALDIYSIASPEPYSATGAGLTSDIIGMWLDIRNGGKFHWGQHLFNAGATLLGIIPYIGDAGNVTKVGAKLVNLSEEINKLLSTTSDFLSKLAKSPVGKTVGTTAGIAGTAWTYMDLTSDDSIILEKSKQALENIKSGNITAEDVISVGNGLAIALLVRKGWKKFRSLDPSYTKNKKSTKNKSNKDTDTNSVSADTNYRDLLTTAIKQNNPDISQEDINAIQNALDKLSSQGFLSRSRDRVKGINLKNDIRKLLREKGKLSETDIDKFINSITKHAKGGIIKAQGGVKVPVNLDFENLDYDSINTLTDFSLYDAKQMAEILNSIPVELHTFNGDPVDETALKRKAIADFIKRLKTLGNVSTGNGTLTYNTDKNQWEHSGWEDRSVLSDVSDSDTENKNKKTTTLGTKKAPKVDDLALKLLNFKKLSDFNSNGTLNSLAGYLVNEIANAKKQEILKDIPIYLEIPTPEKGFKTAYTYNLEKAKNEIMAEANSIKPITSDASQYYAARNEAIKNAREYTAKLDTEINNIIHQVKSDNLDISFENAANRTANTNTNAKYRHDWEIELKLGEVDRIEASNQSFLNLNKEIKHDLVTAYRQKKKQRDTYALKHILKGIMTTPSNYIENWNEYYDLIWYKGQNNLLENDEERMLFQLLYSVVQQAVQSIMALYEGIKYQGIGELHIPQGLKAEYIPKISIGARGMKISKLRICNFINKLK